MDARLAFVVVACEVRCFALLVLVVWIFRLSHPIFIVDTLTLTLHIVGKKTKQ